MIKNLNTESFNQILSQSKKIIVVDFYADWCGPCQMMKPIFEELANETKYQDRVEFIKVNVDENPELASQYNIFSIPTFIFFKNGQPIKNITGAVSKENFISEIDSLF